MSVRPRTGDRGPRRGPPTLVGGCAARFDGGVVRRALALAAALLGLLLMHGVGGHSAHAGQVHATDGHAGAVAQAYDAHAAAGHDPQGDAVHASCTGSCAGEVAAPLPRQVSEVLMTLCLTILLTAAGLLLLGRHWRRPSVLRADVPTPPTPWASLRRVLRPPDLHALSVLRC